jgi:hypothetical protein
LSPERLRQSKLFLSTVFLGAAVCFLLPFLVLTVDLRRGEATGVELATGDAQISGRYVHDAYRGQVEDALDLVQLPAAVAFVAILIGAVGVWIPGRRGFWLGLAAAGAGLLGGFWMRQALTGQQLLAESEWQYGYWLATVLILGSAALAAFLLYRSSWTYLNR